MAGTPGNAPKSWGGQIGDSPGFDASGVLAAAVAEMQLQSYGGVIRLFPAWPKGWQSEFTLAAEGGFLVSSRISANGKIPEIRIASRLGGVLQPRSHRTTSKELPAHLWRRSRCDAVSLLTHRLPLKSIHQAARGGNSNTFSINSRQRRGKPEGRRHDY